MSGTDIKPPLPPFTAETALRKVKMAQDLWNTRDPEKVVLAYNSDTIWRNRDQFMRGHEEVKEFLRKKWEKENGYRLRKDLFAFTDNKIAVQFFYEWFDTKEDGSRQWYRTYGLEVSIIPIHVLFSSLVLNLCQDWTFGDDGRMRKRQMSGNDVPITEEERWFKDGVDVNSLDISEKHL
ncbi:unnamed protein product [Somion occarium]|uniref:DUF1348-domain-containing protein n=1 Tax=Somion occarium TaxID=3059160 RepID=A0ABP1DV29_9APHY